MSTDNVTNYLLVSYRTIPVPGIPTPTFQAPSNYKDEAKIKSYIAEKAEQYQVECANQPYTGTFAEVRLGDTKSEDSIVWNSSDRKPFGTKMPISLVVRDWLLKRYPNAWPHTLMHPPAAAKPEVIFVGFNPRLFLKILGIECSLPENQPRTSTGEEDPKKSNVLPLSMWYGNADHRDIAEAVRPKDVCGDVPWSVVLQRRGLLPRFNDWLGPGVDTLKDFDLTWELLAQLGVADVRSIEAMTA